MLNKLLFCCKQNNNNLLALRHILLKTGKVFIIQLKPKCQNKKTNKLS